MAYHTLAQAQAACCGLGSTCGGVTTEPKSTDGIYTLRTAGQVAVGAPTDVTWVCTSCDVPNPVFTPTAALSSSISSFAANTRSRRLSDSLSVLSSDSINISMATSNYQSGLLGGYLRAVGVAVFDTVRREGFESLMFAPDVNATHQVLIRIRCVKTGVGAGGVGGSGGVGGEGDVVDGGANNDKKDLGQERGDAGVNTHAPPLGPCQWRYFRASIDNGVSELTSPADVSFYYSQLLRYRDGVDEFFAGSLELDLPPAETTRQFDMTRGAVVVTNTDFVGLGQNYGAGSVYWGPGGTLLLTTCAMSNSLLRLGLFDRALDLVGYYMSNFVAQDGKLPGKCAAAPDQV
jgi:hypothetical protein